MHLTFALFACEFLSVVHAEAVDNRLQWRRNQLRKRTSASSGRWCWGSAEHVLGAISLTRNVYSFVYQFYSYKHRNRAITSIIASGPGNTRLVLVLVTFPKQRSTVDPQSLRNSPSRNRIYIACFFGNGSCSVTKTDSVVTNTLPQLRPRQYNLSTARRLIRSGA
jgi:hypothetical protein